MTKPTQQEKPDITIYTVRDIQNIFHLCEKTAYALMKSDGFPSFQINRKIYARKEDVDRWISDQMR